MGKLYLLSASLLKSEPGRTVTSLMQGYRISDSEDAAKGAFVDAVVAEKPEFAISQLLCMAVPDEALSALAQVKP